MRARGLAFSIAPLLSGCHAYQRDPGYALARLAELARDPFHRDNLKYTAVVLIALVIFAVAGAIAARAVTRARSSREPP